MGVIGPPAAGGAHKVLPPPPTGEFSVQGLPGELMSWCVLQFIIIRPLNQTVEVTGMRKVYARSICGVE